MFILDIILLIILLVSAFIGYKKGFSDIVLSIIGFILAIILAFMFKGVVSDIISNNTNIDESILSFISEKIDLESIDKTELEFLVNNLNLQDTVNDKAIEITNFILQVISFIGIFIVTIIVVFILKAVLNLVFELPLIGTANKMLGLAAKVLLTVLNIWILLLLIQIMSPTMPGIVQSINDTILVKFLYENNYLAYLFS